MSKILKLLVVESPTKAKTIKSFLSKDYEVVASVGHIRDLPKSELGVDVDKNFKPKYVIPERAKKNVKKLVDSYKKSTEVYLATDEDREGEAIAFHIAHVLKQKKLKPIPEGGFKRITFHEITREAIEEAIKNPRTVAESLVNAQQARRVLDRLVGYTLSPVLWKKIQYGLSAGRVQSVALRLIVEKEEERNAFLSQVYYNFPSIFSTLKKDLINASLFRWKGKKLEEKSSKDSRNFLITSLEQANTVIKDAKNQNYVVKDVKEREASRKSLAPYTTSTLQQAASNMLGFSSSRTMRAAQKLYENGHITYHRTDSVVLSEKFITKAEKYIKKKFGPEYFLKNSFKNKSKNAQEAHEAIRPTNLTLDLSLADDEIKVYEIIYARALSSLMSPIKTLGTSLVIESENKEFEFRASGFQVIFDGWSKAYSVAKNIKYVPISADTILPATQVGESISLKDIKADKKETQPPARYSEASLIKTLEQYGIGRPSTYAPTITTILGRKYIVKEAGYLQPTDLGIVVTALIKDNFCDIVDYSFTANIEHNLDRVAAGEEKWEKVVKDFYSPFIKKVELASKNLTRDDYKILGEAPSSTKCPECKGKMLIKLGKNGRFYTCAKFPECKGIRDMDGSTEKDIEKKVQTPEFKAVYKNAPMTDDKVSYLLKRGRFGEFWAHPSYPKVKDARPLEYTDKYLKEKYGDSPQTEDGRNFVFRQGKWGPYWAHPDYPEVKETKRIKVEKEESI